MCVARRLESRGKLLIISSLFINCRKARRYVAGESLSGGVEFREIVSWSNRIAFPQKLRDVYKSFHVGASSISQARWKIVKQFRSWVLLPLGISHKRRLKISEALRSRAIMHVRTLARGNIRPTELFTTRNYDTDWHVVRWTLSFRHFFSSALLTLAELRTNVFPFFFPSGCSHSVQDGARLRRVASIIDSTSHQSSNLFASSTGAAVDR